MDNTEWPTVFLNLFNSKQGGGVGEGVLLILIGKLRLRGTGDSFQVTHQLKDS